MKGMKPLFIILIVSIVVATLWNSLPVIKSSVHAALDPTAGSLLNWNISLGILIISVILTLITTLLQKYTTDQEMLKQIKAEQKLVQEEMKKYKEHPEKVLELQKKSMELAGKSMPIVMRPAIFTSIPFILLIRWFGDYFTKVPAGVKLLGFISPNSTFLFPGWIWVYLIASIACSSILRKMLKVH